jgi:hypothetical protein
MGSVPDYQWVGGAWISIIIAAFEIMFGMWLLVGMESRWTHRVALSVFFCFFGVALFKALSGADSCGCFGPLRVNPWYTAAFDLAALVAIALSAPSAMTPTAPTYRGLRWAGVLVVAAISLGAGMYVMSKPAQVSVGSDGMTETQGIIVLEPTKWVGKSLPLAQYIDIGDKFGAGKWIVLLYRADCDHCRAAVPQYEHLSRLKDRRPDLPSVALVEMPPYARPGEDLIYPNTPTLVGRLSNTREWFAETPVALVVEGGKVVFAAEGENAQTPTTVLGMSKRAE